MDEYPAHIGSNQHAVGSSQPQDYKRDFWGTENLRFIEPHLRMVKVARIARSLAGGRQCDLLDVGCGPAALAGLLPDNVRYHGIDIAIQQPAPNLVEMDILESPISFRGMKFDLVVAQGIFEYCGEYQSQKFAEIKELLKDDGKFVVTYMNFTHRKKRNYGPYSNVQSPEDFSRDLARDFVIGRSFPGAHNWNHSLPNRKILKIVQLHLNVNVPVLSPMLAVDHFYICSPR
jgi:cyclopropane fatty-acyl-phospholipid synthase-like methyltransferase